MMISENQTAPIAPIVTFTLTRAHNGVNHLVGAIGTADAPAGVLYTPGTGEMHAAYRAGLCVDCRAVRYSAGRPRCNDCHAVAFAPPPPRPPQSTPPPPPRLPRYKPGTSWIDFLFNQLDGNA